MTFQTRLARALAILQATGMPRGSYEPLALRLLWKAGARIPPPHFMPFLAAAGFSALWFGAAWGTMMWLFVWSGRGMDPLTALETTSLVGMSIGFVLATNYAHGKRKHSLPAWDAIDAGDKPR